MQLNRGLKAPGFNHRTYQVKTRFRSVLSKCNLHRYNVEHAVGADPRRQGRARACEEQARRAQRRHLGRPRQPGGRDGPRAEAVAQLHRLLQGRGIYKLTNSVDS
jgi:hypothetical protein